MFVSTHHTVFFWRWIGDMIWCLNSRTGHKWFLLCNMQWTNCRTLVCPGEHPQCCSQDCGCQEEAQSGRRNRRQLHIRNGLYTERCQELTWHEHFRRACWASQRRHSDNWAHLVCFTLKLSHFCYSSIFFIFWNTQKTTSRCKTRLCGRAKRQRNASVPDTTTSYFRGSKTRGASETNRTRTTHFFHTISGTQGNHKGTNRRAVFSFSFDGLEWRRHCCSKRRVHTKGVLRHHMRIRQMRFMTTLRCVDMEGIQNRKHLFTTNHRRLYHNNLFFEGDSMKPLPLLFTFFSCL